MTGFICLCKPDGMTSFTAANLVRKITGVKKAGHTGTLDPMATGVLPVALSGATRFIELIPNHDKAYKARVRLGLTTDTLDITGEVTGKYPIDCDTDKIKKTVASFSGESMQTPPMYSAKSQGGVRLYSLARQGVNVKREQQKINVYKIEAFDFYDGEFSLSVECSAGTYIRSLADDIGKALGCGAVLVSLCRTNANGFSLSDCVTLEKLRELAADGKISTVLKSTDEVLRSYEPINVTEPQATRFKNGGGLFSDRIGSPETGLYRIYSPQNDFLGIGEVKTGSDLLSVRKVFTGD